MIAYLLNFVLCTGLLLAVYHIFLARERMFRFSRFYLLLSLAFSLIVPLIHVDISPKVALSKPEIVSHIVILPVTYVQQEQPATVVNTYSILFYALLGGYVLVAGFMLFRFFRNLNHISRKVKLNHCVKYQEVTFVLTRDSLTPHSFLNCIFLNKADYENGLIEKEVICHELTHVTQRHSVDVILVELLQAICWFNPFVPLFRKAIQLNHEFLADEHVIESYHNTPAYQRLLLAKASDEGSLYLTSQFNYLTTKKRLIMTTKTTSKKVAMLKQLALVPVLSGALFLFANKVSAQTGPDGSNQQTGKANGGKPVSVVDVPITPVGEYEVILKKYGITDTLTRVNIAQFHFTAADRKRLSMLYQQMTHEQQLSQVLRFVPRKPLFKATPTQTQLAAWADAKTYGVWINGKKANNTELVNYKPTDFGQVYISRLTNAAINHTKHKYQIDLMTAAYYAEYLERTSKEEDLFFSNDKSRGFK